MAIISLGQIDKKLIFVLFLIIWRAIDMIISNEVSDEYTYTYINSLENEIGPIISGIILLFTLKQKQKEEDKSKKNFKYIIYLFILRAIKYSYEKIYPYFIKEKKYKWNNIINTTNGIEIILITFGTFLLLKYKYHIHHYISMIIFFVFGIISDLILGSYSIMDYKYAYIYIIYIINEILIFCYSKYMMDKLYYQYMEIVLYWGITGLIVKLIIFSSFVIHEYVDDIDESILYELYTYFKETNIFIIIFYQFFYNLLYNGVYYVLVILIIYYLRPII